MTAPLHLTHPPRPGVEAGRDVRYTPAWVTESLLEHVRVPQGVLDPCAGDGAILRVMRDHGYPVEWVELRGEEAGGLALLGPGLAGDWCSLHMRYTGSIITNPPYSIGPAFMRACLESEAPFVAALLRLNHLGSASWFRFWRDFPPTGLLILGSRRPSFSADGKTDASEYVWVIWEAGCCANGAQWINVV